MKHYFSIVALVVSATGWAAGSSPSPERVLHYEPTVVSLSGKLSLETFPGSPNYESTKAGDQAETYWILDLDRPISVSPKGEDKDGLQESEKGVHRLQLVMDYEKVVPKKIGFKTGIRMRITGTLFHRISGHHHTPVLLNVIKAEAGP